MKISGNCTIDAPRDQVWAALNDVEVLARIVPGCEQLDQIGENEFEGKVKIGIQAIKGVYSGRIRIEDIQPPHHYRLVASGRSASGVVDGSGAVDLAEQDGKTILTYTGDAAIGGTLASVGQRLIEGAAKQVINQSLKALVEQITARESPPQSASDARAMGQAAERAPDSAPEASAAAPEHDAVPPASVPSSPQPSFDRRTVVVPEHEQLRPESLALGVVQDLLKERPWLVWVAIAFLIGLLFGRARRRG